MFPEKRKCELEELPEALESTCGKVKSKASWFYRAKALMVEGVTTQPVHELCRANSAVWDLLPRRQELQAREYHLCDLSCRLTSSSLRFEDANDLMTLRNTGYPQTMGCLPCGHR